MQVMNLVDDRDIWIMYSQFLVYEHSPENEQSTFIISAFWDKDSPPPTTLWFIKEIVQNKQQTLTSSPSFSLIPCFIKVI